MVVVGPRVKTRGPSALGTLLTSDADRGPVTGCPRRCRWAMGWRAEGRARRPPPRL